MRIASFPLSKTASAAPRSTPASWRRCVRAISASTEAGSGGRDRHSGGGNRGRGGGRRSPSSSSASTSNPSSGFISLPPPSEAAVSSLTASATEHNIPLVVLKGGRSKIFRGEYCSLPLSFPFLFVVLRRSGAAYRASKPRERPLLPPPSFLLLTFLPANAIKKHEKNQEAPRSSTEELSTPLSPALRPREGPSSPSREGTAGPLAGAFTTLTLRCSACG